MGTPRGKSKRADILLVESGRCESRNEAQRLIMAGKVRRGADHVITKPSVKVPVDAELSVENDFPYVSRGALKLLPAIETLHPQIENSVCLDVGASTGGFTDVLLQHGARRVYAVDSGYGQLHYRLRRNPRVISLERTNARYLHAHSIPEPIAILTIDVSFISVTKILPACTAVMDGNAWAFVLVKPQFEAQRDDVGRGGVVRDPDVRQRAVEKVRKYAVTTLNWSFVDTLPSPIQGPAGNQEFMTVYRT